MSNTYFESDAEEAQSAVSKHEAAPTLRDARPHGEVPASPFETRCFATLLRVGFKISDSKYRSIDAETGRYRRPCALGKRSPLRLSNPVLDNDVLRNDTCNQLK